jgi:hypothetical protein
MKRLSWLAFAIAFPIAVLADQPQPKRILFIGDSLSVGGFGVELEKGLSQLPNSEVARFASCGSTVSNWFSGAVTVCGLRKSWPTPNGRKYVAVDPRHCPKTKPKCGPDGGEWIVGPVATPIFSTLKIMGHEPDLTVIALGTNSFDSSREGIEAEVRRMIGAQKKKGGQCAWVGPPDIRQCPVSGGRHVTQADIEKIYTVLGVVTEEPASMCLVIDSRKYAKFHAGPGDCLHVYSNLPSIAGPWASGVLEELRTLIADSPQI